MVLNLPRFHPITMGSTDPTDPHAITIQSRIVVTTIYQRGCGCCGFLILLLLLLLCLAGSLGGGFLSLASFLSSLPRCFFLAGFRGGGFLSLANFLSSLPRCFFLASFIKNSLPRCGCGGCGDC